MLLWLDQSHGTISINQCRVHRPAFGLDARLRRRTRAKQVMMRRSDVRPQTASVRLSRDQSIELARWYVFWSGLSRVWSRLASRPAFVFILLSFAFGSAISVVVPPLRGPDEIAHFLRIHSYTRRGASTSRGSRWSQGNLRRARAVQPALVLQERRRTL